MIQLHSSEIVTFVTKPQGKWIVSKISKLKKSRANWKDKSIDRGGENRKLKKELKRIKRERDRLKQDNKALKAQLDNQSKPMEIEKSDLIHIALQLFVSGRISFRATARVIDILAPRLGIQKAPSHQTIINWLLRLAIVRLNHASDLQPTEVPKGSFTNGFIWMIDTSIGIGEGKILAVLALDANHYKNNSHAPMFKEMHCIAAAVSPSWTGDNITHFLKRIIGILGRPSAILKDGGLDLKKGVSLLAEEQMPCLTIDDVSHKVANLFKHEYGESSLFEVFLCACGQSSKSFKQTPFACLAPPKVSTKARFMNLHKLVAWAKNLLRHSRKGRAPKESMLQKLRDKMNGLPECNAFIERFARDAEPLLACQALIKNNGLSQKTFEECEKIIEPIPPTSRIRSGFIEWAKDQLEIADQLNLREAGLPVTTDPLESFFGLAKKHGTGDVKDAQRIAMRLPATSGEPTLEEAHQVLEVSIREQRAFSDINPSVIAKRRRVLSHPGQIETLASETKEAYLELIPFSKQDPKTGQKNALTSCIVDIFSKNKRPGYDVVYSEKSSEPTPETGT